MRERSKDFEAVHKAAETRPLAPEKLGELARRMVETDDSTEADRLAEEFVLGFYGNEPHA